MSIVTFLSVKRCCSTVVVSHFCRRVFCFLKFSIYYPPLFSFFLISSTPYFSSSSNLFPSIFLFIHFCFGLYLLSSLHPLLTPVLPFPSFSASPLTLPSYHMFSRPRLSCHSTSLSSFSPFLSSPRLSYSVPRGQMRLVKNLSSF